MSKDTTIKKKLTPSLPVAKKSAVEPKVKGKRDTVLVSYTPAELSSIIGPNTPVMVGRKSLTAIREAAALEAAGLR